MIQIMLELNSPKHAGYIMNFPDCLDEKQVKDLKASIEHTINDLMVQTATITRASIGHQIKQALGL